MGSSAPTHEIHAALEKLLREPSLYDEFLRHLARKGHAIRRTRSSTDFSQPYERRPEVVAAFKRIYDETDRGTSTRCARSWSTWKSGFGSGASGR